MDDSEIMHRIQSLVNEEHELTQLSAQEDGGLTDEQKARMRDLEVGLDQCWDLLRQRRARRSAGKNPDAAEVRNEGTVEHYLQ